MYDPGVPSPKSMYASFLMTRITAGVFEIPGLRAFHMSLDACAGIEVGLSAVLSARTGASSPFAARRSIREGRSGRCQQREQGHE